jgi:hypothetical protein
LGDGEPFPELKDRKDNSDSNSPVRLPPLAKKPLVEKQSIAKALNTGVSAKD